MTAGIQIVAPSTIRNCCVSWNAINYDYPPPSSTNGPPPISICPPWFCFWNGGSLPAAGQLAAIRSCDGSVIEESFVTNNAGFGILLDGGGIARNCLVTGNLNGGVIVTSGGTVENCTVVSNTCVPPPFVAVSDSIGGIDLEQIVGSSACVLQNNIVYDNSGNQVATGISNAVISYNCIQGWTNLVNGNISADPQFVTPATGDYHLSSGSPVH